MTRLKMWIVGTVNLLCPALFKSTAKLIKLKRYHKEMLSLISDFDLDPYLEYQFPPDNGPVSKIHLNFKNSKLWIDLSLDKDKYLLWVGTSDLSQSTFKKEVMLEKGLAFNLFAIADHAVRGDLGTNELAYLIRTSFASDFV